MRWALRGLMSPPGMMTMRPAARAISWRISGAPSTTPGSCPEVSSRSTPRPDQRIKAGERIARNIEGAVECHRQRPRRGDERGAARLIDYALRIEQAEDDARGASRFRGLDISAHRGEFVLAIKEISAAWADHRVNLEPAFGDGHRLAHHADGGRQAALQQGRA